MKSPKRPVSPKQAAAINYKAQAKNVPNIRGLPSFVQGKNAGKSMILGRAK